MNDAGPQRGTIVFWRPAAGYGFIRRADGPDVFVHRRDLRDRGPLAVGAPVTFHVALDPFDGRPRAVRVRLVGRGAEARA